MSLNGNNVIGSSGHRTNQPPYEIDQSLRLDGFPGTTNQHLERSPSSSGNRKTFTISFWHKPSLFAKAESDHYIKVKPSASEQFQVSKNASTDTFLIYIEVGNTGKSLTTTRVFRDPSSWYHFVIAVDTTQATASNRVKLYVNGVQETDFGTEQYPDQNWETCYNQSGVNQDLLWSREDSGRSPSGYFAEWHSIDGTALTPTSFGETYADTNQWVPIKYAGSYGTNGFYLKFQDSSALGDDSSGNNNDFTPTNLAATDQVLDSPTNNFCTLNSVFVSASGPGRESTLSEGNLKAVTPTSGSGYNGPAMGTIGMTSGKWYFEWYIGSSNYPAVGIAKADYNTGYAQPNVGNRVWLDGGSLYGVSSSSSGVTYTTGDIVGCAVDMDNGKMWFSKNGTFISSGDPAAGTNAQFTDLLSASDMGSTGQVLPFFSDVNWGTSDTVVFNAGQDSSFAGNKTSGAAGSDFYYTPPTGFKALNTDNLSDPSIADPTAHFNSVLYTGTGGTRSISGVGFQPDFTWIKSRSNTYQHMLFDSVRGATKYLVSDATDAEATDATQLTAFDSDGFSLGSGSVVNGTSATFVGWNWKAGGTASSNSDGTETVSLSANPTAGFSIIAYTGTGTTDGSDTVGHGLSQAPELYFVKARTEASHDWNAYAKPIGVANYVALNLNGASAAQSNGLNHDEAPTSSVITLGSWNAVNESAKNFVIYAFHSVEGYSKVGSYVGNSNSDGPFIYTGFRPAFIMVKLTTAAHGEWVMFDNKRDPDNATDRVFYANLTAISTDVSSYSPYDILSNGFKSRIPGGNGNEASYNSSGQTYLYLAFAESPFKTSNAR